jgi:hypothetical protein
MPTLSREQLLAEIEDILRRMPPMQQIRTPSQENFAWLGRVAAAIEKWDTYKIAYFRLALVELNSSSMSNFDSGLRTILILLHEAQNGLRLETLGSTTIAVPQGSVFEYFDELRKIIELATQDVLFVDPYLDADFISRYLPLVQNSVTVRLLTANDPRKLGILLPAVDLFSKQNDCCIQVRSTAGLHDRYLFIDAATCYHSGASFKDGAKKAGTVISQITDAFRPMLQTYSQLWASAKAERS